VYKKAYGTVASKEVLKFLRRDLIHAIWHLLLSDDFIHAYMYGIVVLCADGIERRLFPRLFLYSADYQEKYVYHWFSLSTAQKFVLGYFLQPLSTLGSGYAHFVIVSRKRYKVWEQRWTCSDVRGAELTLKSDKGGLRRLVSGYSRKDEP
jgi:hypothetical protein